MEYCILAINPGSTSTKVSIFKNETQVFKKNVEHDANQLKTFSSVNEQFDFRLKEVTNALTESGIPLQEFHAAVGRGGFLKPIAGGTYVVGEKMVEDLTHPWKEHASNLGGLLAKRLADSQGIPSFIVDPVVVDELADVARISGTEGLVRKSIFHALNQKAVARKLAEDLKKDYFQSNFVIAHLGGGVSVGAHQRGRIIDVNNGLDGDGAFSPERSGTLPAGDLVNLCFAPNATKQEVYKKIVGGGGLYSYFGTTDAREVERLATENDKAASLILSALSYQVAKEVGAYATVLKGEVDAIALTGGLSHSKMITDAVVERIRFIAPVHIYPGENEMEALAQGALRILRGEEKAKEY